MNTSTTESFRAAISAAGMVPPDRITPDRFIHFPGIGKRRGNTAGWCKMFSDGMGGVFGDYASNFKETWQAERVTTMTPAERDEFARRLEANRKKAEADLLRKHDRAAHVAGSHWNAAEDVPPDHPYLVRKGIAAIGIRLYRGPMTIGGMKCDGAIVLKASNATGEIRSLQFISPEGEKRFLTGGQIAGCYAGVTTSSPDKVLCIAEGYATAASIYAATGWPVAVAFDAGNLLPVAQAMRQKYPDMDIIVCADDDAGTAGNPGMQKAREAAEAIGGKLAIPDFGTDRSPNATDFNDMAAARGLDAVKRAIEGAATPALPEPSPHQEAAPIAIPADLTAQPDTDDGGWSAPLPIAVKVDPEPYPLDALPERIRLAVEEVQKFTQAPIALVASSALAALSVSAQAHADVRRSDKLQGPTGLFFLTIADSGERKSTHDAFFSTPIREYEAEQAELGKPKMREYLANMEAWEAKRSGIKDKIKMLAKGRKPTGDMEFALQDLEDQRPIPPRIPRLIYVDATPEAMSYGMAKHWPSAGVMSSEGGLVLGAHGMGKDSIMRNLAMLNQLWDGNGLTIDRKTSESFTVRGARLTVGLQIQEATLRSFFDRSGALARGTGFLARFLVAWPESTQGTRFFAEAPANWPHLAHYTRRLSEILRQSVSMDQDGALTPPVLVLSVDAKAEWIADHDAVEADLSSGCELYDVRDVASKFADNAARMAALFHLFEGKGGAISVDAFNGASRIVAWHLNESRRFFGELALPAELADAARLDTWLIQHCKRQNTHSVNKNHVRQHGPLRDGARLDAALRELVDLERVQIRKDGKRITLLINPALIGG